MSPIRIGASAGIATPFQFNLVIESEFEGFCDDQFILASREGQGR